MLINYQYPPAPRVKRVIKTITRTFDANENLIEEREEEDTEYEYPPANPYYYSGGSNINFAQTDTSYVYADNGGKIPFHKSGSVTE